ncbi:MAG: hypothetical protein NTY19_33905 [Planctomycetota bacterium]|nr:hypothetical protein [Planctomycetota bacterium]
MKIRLQEGGPVIGSPQRVLDDFSSATEARQAEWANLLSDAGSRCSTSRNARRRETAA